MHSLTTDSARDDLHRAVCIVSPFAHFTSVHRCERTDVDPEAASDRRAHGFDVESFAFDSTRFYNIVSEYGIQIS